ncbi:PREDICTED: cytidine deaminase [Nanorana parkeri]|uniref:cytidine deaminase n=1 Tax=Nanorana parkeri TaxID=125878 RepID=UPI0008545E91|nr:PREDICTED: cytidine deaminase [Nanorana parkeri]
MDNTNAHPQDPCTSSGTTNNNASRRGDGFPADHKIEKSANSALDAELIQKLVTMSHEAKTFAHCPYSKFRVGAALLGKNGHIYLGCNVENASYTVGICAERNAIYKAVSEGCKEFTAIAIARYVPPKSPKVYVYPKLLHGRLRTPFGTEWEIFLAKPSGSFLLTSLHHMLPMSFGPENLKI